ncbi:hypothetical protein QFC21_005071 [Naganishia friedmannii]|uniref:Uncharacterized protein n=1 Tax=Naganishia friedmannii TaxID=89922 RepID=A0ACC2VCJ0_9TREE|nr:hypothetical protein QFC21_005071 [Naganishia friedmannii]
MAAAPPTIGLPAPPRRKVGIALHKYQPGPGHGPVLSYLNAAMLNRAVDPHPLLACEMWDPKVSFLAHIDEVNGDGILADSPRRSVPVAVAEISSSESAPQVVGELDRVSLTIPPALTT